MSAASYAARVEAVLAQRTRLRGPQPPGDLFAGLRPDSPLLTSDPRRALEPNLGILASYVEPDDAIVDVGGGAGRNGLPLALRCRELINVDPSPAMLAGFEASAGKAGVKNVRAVLSDWPMANPPRGTVALVNHVTYLTRDITAFLEGLTAAASRRILLTVGDPPPPSSQGRLFQLVHGEPQEVVPGHAELIDALREMGVEPEVRVLPDPPVPARPEPAREVALERAVAGFQSAQWSFWPLGPELTERVRTAVETHFDELFEPTDAGYLPRGASERREVLLTWQPRR